MVLTAGWPAFGSAGEPDQAHYDDWPREALEPEHGNGLSRDSPFERSVSTLAEQDLAGRGCVAQP
jgi:hypothetical protein